MDLKHLAEDVAHIRHQYMSYNFIILNNNPEDSVIAKYFNNTKFWGNLMKPSNKKYISVVRVRRVGVEGKKKRKFKMWMLRWYLRWIASNTRIRVNNKLAIQWERPHHTIFCNINLNHRVLLKNAESNL